MFWQLFHQKLTVMRNLKTSIVILCFIALTGNSNAQNASWMYGLNTATLTPTTANLGIGISPAYKLDVGGTTRTDYLLIDKPNTVSNWNNLWQSGFYDSENATNAPESSGWFWGINMGYRNNNSGFRVGGQIAIRNSETLPAMYFRSTGVDGSGIWAKVLNDVGGQYINNGFLSVEKSDEAGGYIDIRNHSKTQNGAASSWKIFNMTGGVYGNSLQFWAYDNVGCGGGLCNPRLILMDNGNVGIGTTNPSQALTVQGKIALSPQGTASANAYNGNLIITKPTNSGQYINLIRDSSYPWSIGTVYNNNNFAIGTGQTADTQFTNPFFTINTSGNVGIGLSNASYKLDVKGTIRACEVLVNIANGCDYVFADDYKLMSLNDLSNFIKTNKHLPEVAPAAEMEAEGINLSEMNALLLKKVEELTLYVIELKNEIENLKK